ncbi:hypothetical protein LMG19145_03986 [Xanthomonas arboricola pv. fragariae]|nr:hypothetical protein LMG19145_03986 [Xanthomonas arboricola pv. fragariae]
MTTELEEVVLDTDPFDAKQLLPDVRERALGVSARLDMATGDLGFLAAVR